MSNKKGFVPCFCVTMAEVLHLGQQRVLFTQLFSLNNVNFAKLTVRIPSLFALRGRDDCPPTPKSNWLLLSAL